MRFKIFFLSSIVCLIFSAHSLARIHKHWSFKELSKTSDLIVIASPFATTQFTQEKATLSENIYPPIPVVGVHTPFKILLTLKGKAPNKSIILHHYSYPPAGSGVISINGPTFVWFKVKQDTQKQLLMFLKREKDRKYVAVSGQVDPSGSIFNLSFVGFDS